jgi:hypothetical protein
MSYRYVARHVAAATLSRRQDEVGKGGTLGKRAEALKHKGGVLTGELSLNTCGEDGVVR